MNCILKHNANYHNKPNSQIKLNSRYSKCKDKHFYTVSNIYNNIGNVLIMSRCVSVMLIPTW